MRVNCPLEKKTGERVSPGRKLPGRPRLVVWFIGKLRGGKNGIRI
jgi:hypothetical protein